MKYKIHQNNCIVTGLYKLTNEIPRIYSIMHAKHSGRLTAMHSGRLTAVHSGRRNGSKNLTFRARYELELLTCSLASGSLAASAIKDIMETNNYHMTKQENRIGIQ
jgi:hypothetical protein